MISSHYEFRCSSWRSFSGILYRAGRWCDWPRLKKKADVFLPSTPLHCASLSDLARRAWQ
jgi:hypothetical protein